MTVMYVARRESRIVMINERMFNRIMQNFSLRHSLMPKAYASV